MTSSADTDQWLSIKKCGWETDQYGKSDCPPCPHPLARKQGSAELVSDGRCCFHSKDPEKEVEPLVSAVQDMAIRQRFKCLGWVFPFMVEARETALHEAEFTLAIFQGGADFSGTRFDSEAEFRGAQFRQLTPSEDSLPVRAVFSRCTFKKDARFTEAFFDSAMFPGTCFEDQAWFTGCVFLETVWWMQSEFREAPRFGKTLFPKGVVFFDSVFGGNITFDQTVFGAASDFERVDLSRVVFRRCHLGGLRLATSYGVEKAEFDQVRWGELSRGPADLNRQLRQLRDDGGDIQEALASLVDQLLSDARRQFDIAEERQARQSRRRSDFEAAERVYRQVRRSLDERKHFQEGQRFASRELEMRRLGAAVSDPPIVDFLHRNVATWEGSYRIVAKYGDSVSLPLVWLVGIIVVFPWALAGGGLSIGAEQYYLVPLSDPAAWSGYVDLLQFAIRTAALLPDPTDTRLSIGAQAAQVLLRLIAPFLGVLAGLAVRRRFRR